MYGKLICAFLILVFSAYAGVDIKAGQGLFPISWSGNGALIKGDYNRAFKLAISDSTSGDTIYRYFKLAVIYNQLNDYSKALFLFRLTAQKCADIAPLSYVYIGDIERKQGQNDNALTAYRAALGYTFPSKFKIGIFNKIKLIVGTDSTLLAKAPWLDEYFSWLNTSKSVVTVPKPDTLDSLISRKNWSAADSFITASNVDNERLCIFYKQVFSGDSSQATFGMPTLFRLLSAVISCKNFDAAERLLSMIRKAGELKKAVPEWTLLYWRAQLEYSRGDYEDAARDFKKYAQKNPDPDVIISVARSYKKMNKDNEAGEWYQKHLDLYPNHPRTQEILWLRAWQLEAVNKYEAAENCYQRIYTKYPQGTRAEEAYIRHALCYYRLEQYRSAIEILDKSIKKYSPSSQCLTQFFWKGKCLLAIDSVEAGRKILTDLSKSEPFDYYAHRGRQILILLGDTSGLSIDTGYNLKKAAVWMDSISPRNTYKQLSSVDSCNLRRGVFLASVGAVKDADIFLESLEQSFPGNLRLQFELAWLYLASEASAPAYRVARKLTWRIPVSCRSNLPFAVYSLLFPPFYADYIKSQASVFNVDPYLVSAVIRQESIFNPRIVSPAGAIGLMQIMPFTGKQIANKIGESFVVDSLSSPFPNIKYGTCYLRELLDKFNDNLVLVLASYNGGPHNVVKWYERNKDEESDLFVEDIEFTETRGYVKRVMANYWSYRFLSSNSGYTYGNAVVPKVKINQKQVPLDSSRKGH